MRRPAARLVAAAAPRRPGKPRHLPAARPAAPATEGGRGARAAARSEPVAAARSKNAFLEEIRRAKKFFYGTVVAQAQTNRGRGGPDRVHVRAAASRASRPARSVARVLEDLATRLAGRRMTVVSDEGSAAHPLPKRSRPGLVPAPQGRAQPEAGTRDRPPSRAEATGARRFRRAGDARRLRRGNQGC